MKQHIDDIIKNSETSKSIDLDPQLWQRLERRLDYDKMPAPKLRNRRRHSNSRLLWSRLMIAASFITVFAMASGIYLRSSTYKVTDLDLHARPYFTKDEVQGLQQYYPDMEEGIG